MRLWSLSPHYLDRLGLLGVWREGLLAQQVIAGHTQGYKHHPQLLRFQTHPDPLAAIAAYLTHITVEADRRGYHFNRDKILTQRESDPMPVTEDQIKYEFSHLLKKLRRRDPNLFQSLKKISLPEPHPLFHLTPGTVADWERQ